jgi:hypothetical protein
MLFFKIIENFLKVFYLFYLFILFIFEDFEDFEELVLLYISANLSRRIIIIDLIYYLLLIFRYLY